MNLTLHLIFFGILCLVLVALYIYRHWLENQEDHYIHLHNDSHDASIVSSQTTMTKRLEMIDKVKVGLIVALIAYGLAIAAMGVYVGWNSSSSS